MKSERIEGMRLIWARQINEYGFQWFGDYFIGSFAYCFRLFQTEDACWLHAYANDKTRLIQWQVCMGGPEWADLEWDQQAEDVTMVMKRKPTASSESSGRWKGDAETAAAYPTLCDFLTADEFDGGGKRQRGTLTLMSIDRGWRAVLNDKDTGESLWAAADTLAGLLEALELELLADEPNWKLTRNNQKKK